MRTLVIVAHDDISRSRSNKALADAAEKAGATVSFIGEEIDAAAEQAKLDAADEVVLQFPVQWFSTPARLKAWLDKVLAPGFAYGDRWALEGKKVHLAATTGGTAEAYSLEGAHGKELSDFLLPLAATLRYVKAAPGWTFALHGAHGLGDDELAAKAEEYAARIAGSRKQ